MSKTIALPILLYQHRMNHFREVIEDEVFLQVLEPVRNGVPERGYCFQPGWEHRHFPGWQQDIPLSAKKSQVRNLARG